MWNLSLSMKRNSGLNLVVFLKDRNLMGTNGSPVRFTRYFALVVGAAFTLAGIAGFLPLFTTHPLIPQRTLRHNKNNPSLILERGVC
jgi:hypothetical protein